jgi:catechol 2,3-dioxygenase-like lactoylglutathione lyase family enzyme
MMMNTQTDKPRLEHVNLIVTAIEPTVAFLTAAFPGWRVRGRGNEPFAGMAREWVHVGDDEDYLALTAYDLPADQKGSQRDLSGPTPGLAHLGFVVASIDDVVARLEKAGFAPTLWGQDHPHRRRVYFLDAEGIEYEFIEYLSEAPEERNLYV